MKHDSTTSRPPASLQVPAPLIDVGINLTHDSYDADRDAVIARARAAGVVQMIVTGSTGPSTRQAIELARARPGRLFATAGVHPHHATQLT
ncbi:MAG: hydrolase TatD, partial [Gammaproteobacteria bacterium]